MLEKAYDSRKKHMERNFEKWEKELNIPDPNYNVNLKFEKNKLFTVNV